MPCWSWWYCPFNTFIETDFVLTSLHRRPYKHAIFLGTVYRRASKRTFQFLCVFGGSLVNMPHMACHRGAWLVYMRNHFSESMGSQFVGPEQKALQAMNTFSLLWTFAKSLYPRPVPLTYQPRICKDGFIFTFCYRCGFSPMWSKLFGDITVREHFFENRWVRWSAAEMGRLCTVLILSFIIRTIAQYFHYTWAPEHPSEI